MQSFETKSFIADSLFVGFCLKHKITTKKTLSPWRMTKRLLGEIQGLPTSRGFLVATNGIDCFIERGENDLFFGHLGWFVKDKEEKDVSLDILINNAKKKVGLLVESEKNQALTKALDLLDY